MHHSHPLLCQLAKALEGKQPTSTRDTGREAGPTLYSQTMYWLICTISFALLRSAIQSIQGTHSLICHAFKSPPIDLVTTEANIAIDHV